MSSLTHGLANGLARFPEEMPALERLGLENFDDGRGLDRRATASTATSS